MRYLLLLIPLAVAVAFGYLMNRVRDRQARATALAALGLSLTVGPVGFVMLFLVGETATDPGGWLALGLIVAWLVPTVVLCGIAYLWPNIAVPVLAVSMLPALALGVWGLVDFHGLGSWEDRTGPVVLIAVIVPAVAMALLGLSRLTVAGAMMVAVSVLPIVLPAIGAGAEAGRALTIGTLDLPILISGLLYLWAGHLTKGADSPLNGLRRKPHLFTGHRTRHAPA
ncbi:hypothetical protein GCM10009841_23260 [Microlunatus panaciterrae]